MPVAVQQRLLARVRDQEESLGILIGVFAINPVLRRSCAWPHFVARISSWAKSALRIDIYLRRTYSGRPSFSIRLSDATAMATSVVCRPSVRERSASPITRL